MIVSNSSGFPICVVQLFHSFYSKDIGELRLAGVLLPLNLRFTSQ